MEKIDLIKKLYFEEKYYEDEILNIVSSPLGEQQERS